MNASFEIMEPLGEYYTSNKNGGTSFSASAVKHIPFVAASLSVAMSLGAFDTKNADGQYGLVYFDVESSFNRLASALGADYEVKYKLLKRLDVLKTSLENNWNGENDYPIEEKAYNNAKSAIWATPSAMLRYWRLFPNPNGTLLLSPKDKSIAGISIGNEEFSYAAFVSDDKQISGKEPFDIPAFKFALQQIHRILKYD